MPERLVVEEDLLHADIAVHHGADLTVAHGKSILPPIVLTKTVS